MTLPYERVQAIRLAGDFLSRLTDNYKIRRVPEEVRDEAQLILRHFPSPVDVDIFKRLEGVDPQRRLADRDFGGSAMNSHTPGPWTWINKDGRDELVGADLTRVHSDGSAARGEYNPCIDVNGPDARLIASAPELLAELKEARDAAAHLCRIIAEHDLIGECDPKYNGFGKRINDAIAKAEGKAKV